MVEPMNLVNIVGSLKYMDELIEEYILGQDIHLENPLQVLKSTKGFLPHTGGNPYEQVLKRFTDVFEYAGINYKDIKRHKGEMTIDELQSQIEEFDDKIHSVRHQINTITDKINQAEQEINILTPIAEAEINIDELINMRFLKFRFGRLPVDSHAKLEAYLRDLPAYFELLSQDREYVWGFYFATHDNVKRIDHIFATLYFKRVRIEGEI